MKTSWKRKPQKLLQTISSKNQWEHMSARAKGVFWPWPCLMEIWHPGIKESYCSIKRTPRVGEFFAQTVWGFKWGIGRGHRRWGAKWWLWGIFPEYRYKTAKVEQQTKKSMRWEMYSASHCGYIAICFDLHRMHCVQRWVIMRLESAHRRIQGSVDEYFCEI